MEHSYTGPYPTREDIMKDRLMDACVLAVHEYGLRGFMMKHVIEKSGTSRQTVYNHYKNKTDLLWDSFTREGVRMSKSCGEEMKRYEGIEDKFVKGYVYVCFHLPRNPLLKELIHHNEDVFAEMGHGRISIEHFGQFCFGELFEMFPALAKDAKEISEYWSRSVLSHLVLPDQEVRSSKELEDYVRRRFVPGLRLHEYTH